MRRAVLGSLLALLIVVGSAAPAFAPPIRGGGSQHQIIQKEPPKRYLAP